MCQVSRINSHTKNNHRSEYLIKVGASRESRKKRAALGINRHIINKAIISCVIATRTLPFIIFVNTVSTDFTILVILQDLHFYQCHSLDTLDIVENIL